MQPEALGLAGHDKPVPHLKVNRNRVLCSPVPELKPACCPERQAGYCRTAARDLHTPVFDRTGVLWFTVQRANMVGKLVPQTGEMMLQRVPTPNALPYGIAVNSGGVPFFAEFGRRLPAWTRSRNVHNTNAGLARSL